ncbi:hypothetical protein DICPUDRAFT_158013 [Dictyostelium purpureum]|uniref:Uncharacterized protein n=1 Tax=Dictyostelium purpureum TaxID=5786 RepID=F1A0L2_DICPU|nr:uncharacterized protein DICPUDRAFT_158013 [Dictyostelium purpureum]EGC30279.1 hypothetical protein DICPUDRAFT_158013 [Dictyostelium purpureum]|eukprot:XP_003293206.1 hypothetical protein DICPUDRAFT_158013 [Dictyostelium purpureum]
MFTKITKSNSSKNFSNYYPQVNNINKLYKDTDNLTSKSFITPTMVLYGIGVGNETSSQKVVVKITNRYLEVMEKNSLTVIKTILLRDIREFSHSGHFWEITYRNEKNEFVIYSLQSQKAYSTNNKVLEFLKEIKKDDDFTNFANDEYYSNNMY